MIDIEAEGVVVFTSWGNDSVALLQHLIDMLPLNVSITALYSDTGWAAPWWEDRVSRLATWAKQQGVDVVTTYSEGMIALARRKKGWPTNQFQFCTLELKIKPAMNWLEANDPGRLLVCANGVRRSESKRRADYPEWTPSSGNHGDRPLWAPLVDHTDKMRDALLRRAGVEPLPHRSMECFPCINSNRADLLTLASDEERITEISRLETSMGYTSKGKPRTLFRPHRHRGAVGIHQVIQWAKKDFSYMLDKQKDVDVDDETECSDAGWCGS